MRGIRFSALIAIPFVLGALYSGINLIYLEKDEHLFWLLGFLAVVIGVFFASSELDYWYDKKYPPKLDPPIIEWLRRYFPFYSQIEGDDRAKFEIRLALYLYGRAFNLMMKEKGNIPEDFKGIIAAHAIRMTMGLDDFLIKKFERIICYNHPFPTPRYQFLHTVETHTEDGVILLSVEQLMMGIGKPKIFYNIAYHAYAEALLHLYPELANIKNRDDDWKLESILKYKLEKIAKFTGYESPDINDIGLASFFIDNENFKTVWPDQYDHYAKILNYDFNF